jgi:hypothetical protein
MAGLFSAEAGEFFSSHAFQGQDGKERATQMTAALTKMWDGGSLIKTTGMETVQLFGRRLNMLFLLQDSMFSSFLNNPNFSNQGFTHRLLIAHCDYFTKPIWDVTPKGKSDRIKTENSLSSFHNRIFDLLNQSFRVKANTAFELELPVMEMSPEAEVLLANFFNEWRVKKMFEDEKYIGFQSRSHEHALRLAANLAIFEGKQVIDEVCMYNGIELIKYFIDQRKTLVTGIVANNPAVVTDAESLIKWIIDKQFSGTLNELRQCGPYGYRKCDSKQRTAILEEMESNNSIEFYKDGKSTRIRIVAAS